MKVFDTKQEVIEFINTLAGYEGYVQFSHRRLDMQKDVFMDGSVVKVEDEEGFIYEAHFFNGKDTVSIKQINNKWFVDEENNIPLSDVQTFIAKDNLKVKMAQIWEKYEDELCEGLSAMRVKKIVFAGFEGGQS